jgi:hypothetical protein
MSRSDPVGGCEAGSDSRLSFAPLTGVYIIKMI